MPQTKVLLAQKTLNRLKTIYKKNTNNYSHIKPKGISQIILISNSNKKNANKIKDFLLT